MKRIVLLLLLIASLMPAQQKVLKGIITDEDGNALSSANIMIQDKMIGASSDSLGHFSIKGNINSEDVLIVSYVGYITRSVDIQSLNYDENNEIVMTKAAITSQTVLVKGSMGEKGITPMSFTKLERKEIDEAYVNQDIPEMLSYMPSTTFYSEGGAGIGYNYLSIRGFDQRRISVSINGIPQNDPEDHNIYWVDFPDLLESTELIHVQRGAGAGLIGYPSVGGSINIITSNFSNKSQMKLSAMLGSYNTRKYSASFSSGLIDGKYSVYAKISQTLSDGYRDNNWINFKSYYVSGVRYDEDVTTQFNFFGGPIADGLTYTGLPKFTIKNRSLRRENNSYWEADENGYTYKLKRRDDEIENFSQPHFELLNEIKLSENSTLNSALFLVQGKGFFDYDGSWSVFYDDYFRLSANGFNTEQQPTNALIRAYVDNTQWGWIPRYRLNHGNGELILGAELRFHRSKHWGNINYAENLPLGITKDYEYYYYEGGKEIINFYAHEKYNINEKLNLLLEAQLAYHNYAFKNEKYVGNEFEVSGLFFNPKIGFNYKFSPSLSGFVSFANVTREPRLKNYYDAAESSAGETPQFELNENGNYNFDNPLVKPETMSDFELGTTYVGADFSISANIFYMLFNDEIVKNGQVDRFGQPITGNMSRTVHTGFEFSYSQKFFDYIELILNGLYSKNYIGEGETFISENEPLNLEGNRISGFPDITFNGIVKFNYREFYSRFTIKYVGDFFSDNYDENIAEYESKYPGFIDYFDNKVDAYAVANILMGYNFDLEPAFKNINLYVQVNNIFDNLYAAYAIGKEFFPAAERFTNVGIKLGL